MPVSPTATTRGWAASSSSSARAASVERVGAGRVQRDRRVDPRIPLGRLGGPAGGLQVVGDRDHRLDADGRGAVEDRADVVGVDGTARVEVGVRVDQRRQRLRQRWRLPVR